MSSFFHSELLAPSLHLTLRHLRRKPDENWVYTLHSSLRFLVWFLSGFASVSTFLTTATLPMLTETAAAAETKPAPQTECHPATIKTPPIFVVPTGYDSASDEDAVTRKKESQYANYYKGNSSVDERGRAVGKPYIVPKRSIVQVSDVYRNQIENSGTLSKFQGSEWIPVKVLSLPPENKKLQEAHLKSTKSIAKYQYQRNVQEASVGSVGFMQLSNLEKIEKQKDYVFIVKQDSELFTGLNNYLNQNDYESLVPMVLKLKQNDEGFEVNQCCIEGTTRCSNYPIFEVMNVKDEKGQAVDLPVDTDCFTCEKNIFKSIVPIEESILDPIRSILSHPSLGLPEGTSDVKRAASITHLNFVDSRGFVQIPISGEGPKKTGPFKSLHYGAESGDADVYMKPDVACGFMQFLKAWDKKCNGRDDCVIEFGDASHASHKSCTRRKNQAGQVVCSEPWPHVSHTDGECLDINTSRMAKKQLAPMTNMLKKLGSAKCLTMDKNILAQGGCTYDKTGVHDTHMHICFPTNSGHTGNSIPNPKLKEACEKGVKP